MSTYNSLIYIDSTITGRLHDAGRTSGRGDLYQTPSESFGCAAACCYCTAVRPPKKVDNRTARRLGCYSYVALPSSVYDGACSDAVVL